MGETKWRKYRKKPLVIEAYQTGTEQVIDTLEGKMAAQVGDWIVRGIKGELYPVKNDIFLTSYEPAGD